MILFMTWQLNNVLIMSKISITHVIPQVLTMHPMVHTQTLNPLLPNNPSIVPKRFNPKTWLEHITLNFLLLFQLLKIILLISTFTKYIKYLVTHQFCDHIKF